jgi:hypothetical protein
MKPELWRSIAPAELNADARHARFEREATTDRWVQAHGAEMAREYEDHASAERLLDFAVGPWTRQREDAIEVEQGIAAIAAGVAAHSRGNLEPACSRLLWATRRERIDQGALDGAEHYALLALATAQRNADRDAAQCVCEAVRFVRAGRKHDLDARSAALERFATLASKRVPNFASLVGAHFPFWSFPFAFRWDDPAPPAGRGRLGLSDPLDVDRLEGLFTLAYRSGRDRLELAEAIERCACAARRIAPGGLEQARATGAISELGRDLRDSWVVRDALSPTDVVSRVVPRTLALPFVPSTPDLDAAHRRAAAFLSPVLRAHWPELARLSAEHRAFRAARSGEALAA